MVAGAFPSLMHRPPSASLRGRHEFAYAAADLFVFPGFESEVTPF
jgi:hypothetical protein